MDFSTVRRWWSEVGVRQRVRRRAEPDRGDMGTAVALDASLEPTEGDAFTFETQPGVWALSWEERAARRGL